MSGPQVAIDLGRTECNARTIVERCALSHIKVFGVTKGMCGMPQVARAMPRRCRRIDAVNFVMSAFGKWIL